MLFINIQIISSYHSNLAGKRESWIRIPVLDKNGKKPPCLFYAPFTLDKENPKNIAFGSDRIFLDSNQGLDGWKTINDDEKFYKIRFP